jgi:hypothetical protein
MGLPLQEAAEERRSRTRRRVFKTAKIALQNHCSAIDCTVRNLSEGGACLKIESSFGIPERFDLVLDSGIVRNCRIAWRKATQIGVEFI